VKSRSTIASIVLAVALLTGCTSTYSYRLKFAGNPRRAEAEACWARCRRSQNASCVASCPGVRESEGVCKSEVAIAEQADCGYWKQLLAYQPDAAGRQRISTSMPTECRNQAGLPVAAAAPAPVCRQELRVNGVKTVGVLLGIVAVGYLGVAAMFSQTDIGHQE